MAHTTVFSFLPAQEARRLHEHRLLQLQTLGPCGLIAFGMAALDMWQGHAWVACAAVLLGIGLLAEFSLIYLRWWPLPAEMFMVAAASLWIYGKFDAYGNQGVGWACALIAGLSLLSTARHGSLVAFPLFSVSLLAIWKYLPTEDALGSTVTVLLATAFTNIFRLSMNRDRRAMTRRRRRLDLLLRCSDIGSLEMDGNVYPYFSPRLCVMLGLPTDPSEEDRDLFRYVHPDHVDLVRSTFRAQVKEITEPFAAQVMQWMEYPLIDVKGAETWVHAKAMRVSDKNGKFARYVCTFTDINRRVLAEHALRDSHAQVAAQAAELQRRHEQLASALRTREEVERIARHDLKTPLGNIASIPQRMRALRLYSQEEEAYLDAIEATAQRAMRMLQLQMDFYRMEDGRYEFTPTQVDLTCIAKKAAQTFSRHARSKLIDIRLVNMDEPAFAVADAMLCETIVENILRNAIEASPDEAAVSMTIVRTTRIGIAIHNEGAVPSEMIRTFFHKYSTSGKTGGNGLGTYSAWLMARVQGGDLKLHTSEKAGTTVTLKVNRPLLEPDEVDPYQDFESSAPAPLTAVVADTLDKLVLIVDDDDYNAMWLADALRPYARVEVAINGRAAVDAVKLRRPDAIFMDMEMPVMNGIEALRHIRAYQQNISQRPSKIVAFTAHDDLATRLRCVEEGFDGCVIKPLPRDHIPALVANLLT